MSPITAVQRGISRTFDFRGRSSRSEFMPFGLFAAALLIGAQVADGLVSGSVGQALAGTGPIALTTDFLVGIPLISAVTRRLHDTDHSGWLQLLWLTCLGALPVLVMLGAEGDQGTNRFGPPAE